MRSRIGMVVLAVMTAALGLSPAAAAPPYQEPYTWSYGLFNPATGSWSATPTADETTGKVSVDVVARELSPVGYVKSDSCDQNQVVNPLGCVSGQAYAQVGGVFPLPNRTPTITARFTIPSGMDAPVVSTNQIPDGGHCPEIIEASRCHNEAVFVGFIVDFLDCSATCTGIGWGGGQWECIGGNYPGWCTTRTGAVPVSIEIRQLPPTATHARILAGIAGSVTVAGGPTVAVIHANATVDDITLT